MTNREIDTALAEMLFGWKWVAWKGQRYIVPLNEGLRDDEIWASGDEDVWAAGTRDVPHYSASIRGAFEVEAEIERHGRTVMLDYCDALMRQCGVGSFSLEENLFKLIHSSAADRCRAALSALSAIGTDGDK